MAAKKASVKSAEEVIEPGRVKKLIIKNFRAIGQNGVTIDLDDIVVLVGPNNAGKSSILRAYEVVMQDGSKEGHLTIDDFSGGVVHPENLPVIELHTAVTKYPPASKWVANEDNEPIMKERWVWKSIGLGTRQGWNTQIENGGGWDEEGVPYGATNVANARRPQPYWVKAFDNPDEQAEKINKLITTIISDKARQIPCKDGTDSSEFDRLLRLLKDFQDQAFEQAKADVGDIEKRLTSMVADVFANHVINFSLHPPIEKDIKLFSGGSNLSVGHENGWRGPIKNQGSGARRTILWAVLRVLSEQTSKTSQRPRVLLIDEPELCLHPNAIREACRVLYDLAKHAGWQVMVTTHSPVFIDLSRDNTTVIRVERAAPDDIIGTTLYRPDKVKLDDDDRENMKLLNIYDPYVAEFFFGGQVIVVEGDTEYAAFQYIISKVAAEKVSGALAKKIANVQIIRARGKATIVSLCKILNQFGAPYSILHDTDRPEVIAKDGTIKKKKNGENGKNSAWTLNKSILNAVNSALHPERIRVLASRENFEAAFLESKKTKDKPYNAIRELSQHSGRFDKVHNLLLALLDHKHPIPEGAIDAKKLKAEDLKAAA